MMAPTTCTDADVPKARENFPFLAMTKFALYDRINRAEEWYGRKILLTR
jgi:hypothetical protein